MTLSTKELVERLRLVESSTLNMSDSVTTCWYRNPDGPAAADLIESLLADLSAVGLEGEALDWFSGQHSLELSWYCPTYGDDDDQAREWRVHRVSGSINDREWDQVGHGETALDAILSARDAQPLDPKGPPPND